MGRWRSQVGPFGLNLGDGMSPLLDLGFADDMLLFEESAQGLGSWNWKFAQAKAHKWLGCLWSTFNMGNRQQHMSHGL